MNWFSSCLTGRHISVKTENCLSAAPLTSRGVTWIVFKDLWFSLAALCKISHQLTPTGNLRQLQIGLWFLFLEFIRKLVSSVVAPTLSKLLLLLFIVIIVMIIMIIMIIIVIVIMVMITIIIIKVIIIIIILAHDKIKSTLLPCIFIVVTIKHCNAF